MQDVSPKFKVGDCVQLPSGGPKMTISVLKMQPVMNRAKEPYFYGLVVCNWFDNLNILIKDTFHQDQLVLCNEKAA